MDRQVIEMGGGDFAEWAEREFSVDYDDVRLWDMMKDLGSTRMPEGFEVSQGDVIPAELHSILVARKASREVEQYKMATGFYDEGAIMQAGGVDERNARFADIFGDVQGKADLSPDYQALLDEARRRNAEMHANAEQAQQQEARAIVAKAEPWSRDDWKRLVALGFASSYTEDGGEQGYMSTSYGLTERGQQLLDPSYRAPGTYDDQVGIDG